jgi:hypothetical protein
MDEMLQNLMQRSLDISRQIALQRMPQSSRQDLRRMMGVADDLVRDLSREGVNCRRLRRQTRQFDEIAQQAEQALLNVEQHLLLARLRY